MANEDTVILKTGEITLLQQADRGAKRRSCLILYSGTATGKRFILDVERMTIGRMATAEIFVDTPSVSRRHAELEVSGERVVLNDLGSANGTHVNDRRIEGPDAGQPSQIEIRADAYGADRAPIASVQLGEFVG